jgi:diacylglycerol kinase family enzyme
LSRVPIILNPTAGGGRLLGYRIELDAAARAVGVELEWWPTEVKGDGEQLAARAVDLDHPLVLAWGGDGTYNEVARGLVGSSTAIGVLPGGTTSVLAYELEIPRPAPRALQALVAGGDRPMRVGRSDRGDLVVLMLSSGPDAVIVRDAFARRRRHDGKLGIAVQALRELTGRRPLPRLRIRVGDRSVEGGWVIVGNSACFGGPYRATPGADPFEPGFEVVVQRSVGRVPATAFALSLPLSRHLNRGDVVRLTCDRVTIEPVPGDAETPYQVDGDPLMGLPVTLEVDPRPLLIRLPSRT